MENQPKPEIDYASPYLHIRAVSLEIHEAASTGAFQKALILANELEAHVRDLKDALQLKV
jgi:hypothetical protein